MKPELTVLARIALYVVSGRLIAGGWLPAELQPELVSPAVVEAVIGVGVGLATYCWYLVSQARKALYDAVRKALR